MACLENVQMEQMYFDLDSREWVTAKGAKSRAMPHIFFDDGEPWVAANEYALSKLQAVSGNKIKTIVSIMGHLKAYASWLEDSGMNWREFPRKKKERCIFRYRGFLVDQRDVGLLSPSTATSRMRAIIKFYRWAQVYGWVERIKLWEDRIKLVKVENTVGFSRSMSVVSSELAIPNTKRVGLRLEGGLLPVSIENRDILLKFLYDRAMLELYLMAMIGFFSGARSETIRTLRLSSLENAVSDPGNVGIKRVSVGPGTGVKTKFDVSGELLFPSPLVEELRRYAYSARRLMRQAKATDEDKALLFLTQRGNQYSETSFTKLISSLREKLVSEGFTQFKDFVFHQSRATFGTQLMRFAMQALPSQADAIVFVRDALLHKNESTTWKYIKFIEIEPVKERLSEEFFNLFTGAEHSADALINQVTHEYGA